MPYYIWNQIHILQSFAAFCRHRRLPVGSPKDPLYQHRNGNLEIYSMNPDGTAQTRVMNHAAVDAFPTWSPDRTKIAFTSNRTGSSNFDVHVMNANGTSVTWLTTLTKTRHNLDPRKTVHP